MKRPIYACEAHSTDLSSICKPTARQAKNAYEVFLIGYKNINGQLLNRVVWEPKYYSKNHATKGPLKNLSRAASSWTTPPDSVNYENYDMSDK